MKSGVLECKSKCTVQSRGVKEAGLEEEICTTSLLKHKHFSVFVCRSLFGAEGGPDQPLDP